MEPTTAARVHNYIIYVSVSHIYINYTMPATRLTGARVAILTPYPFDGMVKSHSTGDCHMPTTFWEFLGFLMLIYFGCFIGSLLYHATAITVFRWVPDTDIRSTFAAVCAAIALYHSLGVK